MIAAARPSARPALHPSPSLHGPARDFDGLKYRITTILSRHRIPGAGLTLVTRGGPSWVGGLGASRIPGGTVTADTVFRLGSLSKSVTALAVMQLVESGRLSLDDRLRDVAPEVTFVNRWEHTAPVRVANLLEHTAGFEDGRFNEDWDRGPEPMKLRQALARNPRSKVSRWPPGTRMCYGSQGYLIAGYLLEKITGRSFDDVVWSQIFEPLSMTGASFKRNSADAGELALGHGPSGRPVAYLEDFQRPAANLMATPLDLLGYLRLWLGRGAVGSVRLLSETGIERMESGTSLPYRGLATLYGLGLSTDHHAGYSTLGHTGWTLGFHSSFRYLPVEGVGWALMLNGSDRRGAREEIEQEVAAFMLLGSSPPRRSPAVPDIADELASLAGFYRDAAPKDDFSAPLSTIFGGNEYRVAGGILSERSFEPGGPRSLFRRGRWRYLEPTGEGGFRGMGEAGASILFTKDSGGRAVVATEFGYLEKRSSIVAAIQRALFIVAVLTLLSSLVVVPALLVEPLFGGRWPDRIVERMLPALAAFMPAAGYALFRRSREGLGFRNPTTVTIFVASVLFPLLAAASLALSIGHASTGGTENAYFVYVSMVEVGLAAFAWGARWIALRTWLW